MNFNLLYLYKPGGPSYGVSSMLQIKIIRSIIAFCCALTPLFFINTSCQSRKSESVQNDAYRRSIQDWQKERIKRLTQEDGWLSLSGLFWLNEGVHSFGSSQENDIVFPAEDLPSKMGYFILKDKTVKIKINAGVAVYHQGQLVEELTLQSDKEGNPTILTSRTYSWYIIERGQQVGIRLKDSANSRLKNFKGIETYPIDPEWCLKASLKPYDPPKRIQVPNVTGTVNEEECPAALQFAVHGQTFQLDPIVEKDSKKYFIIFADETNAEETYGAGRFLYVDMPDTNTNMYIDFNKAYNPPCAFSDFATCPLPPRQNRLPIKISAGEKKYNTAGH